MPRLDLSVSRVVQSTDWNCWAASLAVMLGRSTDTEIVDELKRRFPDANWDDGATPVELGWAARQFGLNQVYPVCQGPDGWEQWLSSYGPLLIQVPGNSHHSVVVAGVEYASEEEQVSMESKLRVIDPWHSGGGDNWLSFDDANARYELAGSNWPNNVYAR
jgi:ABC-type bacteriocin/lantibiotic exporter with double-glycine peptidase domain